MFTVEKERDFFKTRGVRAPSKPNWVLSHKPRSSFMIHRYCLTDCTRTWMYKRCTNIRYDQSLIALWNWQARPRSFFLQRRGLLWRVWCTMAPAPTRENGFPVSKTETYFTTSLFIHLFWSTGVIRKEVSLRNECDYWLVVTSSFQSVTTLSNKKKEFSCQALLPSIGHSKIRILRPV